MARPRRWVPTKPQVWSTWLEPFEFHGRVIHTERRWHWACTCGRRGGTSDFYTTHINLGRHLRSYCRDNPERKL